MQLIIEKLIYGGDGLARLPAQDIPAERLPSAGLPADSHPSDKHGRGKAVFIPFVLEDERVEASLVEQKKGFARGSVNELLEASPHRVEPHCPYFARCGGCHYQHSSYQHQLEIKASILRENLRRLAKLELDTELQIHRSPEWNYRNRTRLTVRSSPESGRGSVWDASSQIPRPAGESAGLRDDLIQKKSKLNDYPEFALCYHKFNSNQLLAVEECPISSPLINRAIAQMCELGRSGEVPDLIREIEFFASADDAQLLIEISCAGEISTSDTEQWTGNVRRQMPEVVGIAAFKKRFSNSFPEPKGKEKFTSAGEASLIYKTAHGSYRVSAGSFFQVNRHLVDELVNIVTKDCSGGTALDLYAGVGLFSSVLNREFQRVIVVESSPTSYADLLYNSPANVKAIQSRTEDYLRNAVGKLRPDLIVVDPPRAGLSDEVIGSLIGLRAPRLTYVSCDPATLARDLRSLLSSGYRIKQAHLIDLFPQTFHVESVFHLVR